MLTKKTFADIVEAADNLSQEEQKELILILQNRLRDQQRAELIKDVQEAQKEFTEGNCSPINPQKIMQKILS